MNECMYVCMYVKKKKREKLEDASKCINRKHQLMQS